MRRRSIRIVCAGAVTLLASLGVPIVAATSASAAAETPTCHGELATVFGTSGDDRVVGSGLTAGLTYRGGDGNDTVQAGSVADRLHGGLGLDVFRFVSLNATGEDQVQDWEAGLDRLDVSGLGARAADVSWVRSGNDTLITVTVPPELGGGILRIRLARYTGPLSLDDFVFAP